MRTIFIIISMALMTPVFAELDIKEMKMMIQKIKEPRVGNTKSKNLSSTNPFQVVKDIKIAPQSIRPQPDNTIEIPVKLNATVNKKANINGKWLGVGDKIEGYEIVYISNGKIKITKDNEVQELTIKEIQQTVKFK